MTEVVFAFSPLDFECYACGAKAGEKCTTMKSRYSKHTVSYVHDSRERKMRSAKEDALRKQKRLAWEALNGVQETLF